MKKKIATIFFCGLLLAYISSFTCLCPEVHAEEKTRYISETEVVSADTEEDALNKLKHGGFIPVMKNLAESGDGSAPYVYMGYKTTDDPAGSIENSADMNTGSVFGGSYAIMIGGIGVILGVVIGMISMKVKRKGTEDRKEEAHDK